MRVLVDTHVLLWLSDDSERLSDPARTVLAQAAAAGGLAVSAISYWEVAMLASRGRISLAMPVPAFRDRARQQAGIVEVPVDGDIAIESVALPEWRHADPADRIIVATARIHGCVLVTRDAAILAYGETGAVTTVVA
ncbi:MAG: type II toxin-antitoxin system VapC family toxin [Myxococcota bacterium]